jgi:hypothetical protein
MINIIILDKYVIIVLTTFIATCKSNYVSFAKYTIPWAPLPYTCLSLYHLNSVWPVKSGNSSSGFFFI